MIKVRLFFFALFMSYIANSYSFPNWITNMAKDEFTSDLYLVGVGEGQTLSESEVNAISKIAQKIEVDVQVLFINENFLTNDSFNKKASKSTKLSSDVKGLSGIEFVKRYKKDGVFYTLAVLNIDAYTKRISKDISLKINLFNQEVSFYNLNKEKNFNTALKNIEIMSIISNSVKEKTDWIRRVNPKFIEEFRLDLTLTKIISEFKNDLEYMHEKGVNSLEFVLGQHPKMIKSTAIYRGKALSKVPVIVYWQKNGKLIKIDESMTDVNGKFELKISHKNLYWKKGIKNSFIAGVKSSIDLLEESYLVYKSDLNKVGFSLKNLEINPSISNLELKNIAISSGFNVNIDSANELKGTIYILKNNDNSRIKRGRLEGNVFILNNGEVKKNIDISKLNLVFSGLNDRQLNINSKKALKKLFSRINKII